MKMSKQGVKAVAQIFSDMQQLRIKLLGGDNQDILLAQSVLETMKDAGKVPFAKNSVARPRREEG